MKENECKAVVFISRNEGKKISEWLKEGGQGEDNVYFQSVRFPNGIEADIKCCGCQDGPSWTEMVLFRNGSELCCTDVCDEYFGEFLLEYDGVRYRVTIKEEPLCWNCGYVGDGKSFPQPNDKILRHYYCNCGDCQYYDHDISEKEIHECEHFEEI